MSNGIIDPGGRKAAVNGYRVEEIIRLHLGVANYTLNNAKTLEYFEASKRGFFPESGQYATQCYVPLTHPCHEGMGREVKVDFLILPNHGNYVLLSVKSQQSGGSADEKLEFEVRRLMATGFISSLLLFGNGFRTGVIQEIYERAKYESRGRVMFFRDINSFEKWMNDGFPIGTGDNRQQEMFEKYCGQDPFSVIADSIG